jgi:E3 ubiquitin-protein ligase RGLG
MISSLQSFLFCANPICIFPPSRKLNRIPPRKPLEPPPAVLEADSLITPPYIAPKSYGYPSYQSSAPSAPSPSAPALDVNSDSNCCPICLTNKRNLVFQCGHQVRKLRLILQPFCLCLNLTVSCQTCEDCGKVLTQCPICRANISQKIKLFG